MEKKKIMIIDDSEDFLNIVKINLEETGKYEVLTLLDVKSLTSLLSMFKPDIILLDLVMAVGGIRVCKMLNNDPIGKAIPIIIVSALGDAAAKLKQDEERVVDYLVKPIDKNDLIDKIEKVLQK